MSKSVSAIRAEEAAAKRKRNIITASLVLAALVIVGIVIAASGGKDKKTVDSASKLNSVAETKALFAGIPQHGKILGDPKAKVTLIEFADLQCPFCKQYTLGAFPTVVKDYVRTGKVKLQLETLSFLGSDSEKAGRFAAAAAQQNKLWNFADLMYHNQGAENSGYVTPKYLDALLEGAGVDVAKANAFARTAASKLPVREATSLGQDYGVISTPTFVAGPTGGKLDTIQVSNTDANSFKLLDTLAK